jgi:hypothetical protein
VDEVATLLLFSLYDVLPSPASSALEVMVGEFDAL